MITQCLSDNLKANSKVTEIINRTPTVLPIWYCDPTLSAPACQGCPGSTSSDNSISVSVKCTLVPLSAGNFTFSADTSPIWTAPSGSAAPSLTEALPVLSLTNADPAHPTIWAACGPRNSNPYYNSGFFQLGESFSRNAELDVVRNFCNDMVASSIVVAPPGLTPTKPGASKRTSIPLVIRSYD